MFQSTRALCVIAMLAMEFQASEMRLDPSFGQKGHVISEQPSTADHTRRMRVQTNGKILVLATNSVDTIGVPRMASIYRFNSDGSRDLSFAGTGSISISGLRDFGLLGDDRIVVVITDYAIPTGTRVCRFSTEGIADSTFAGSGCRALGGSSRHEGRKITLQRDGRIVVAGATESGATFLARLTPNGDFDTSFQNTGMVYSWGIDFAYTIVGAWTLDSTGDIAVQPDGKIVYGFGGGWSNLHYLARVNADGSADPGFGFGGYVPIEVPISAYPYDTFSSAVLALPDGNILAAGTAVGWRGDSVATVTRLGPNGTPDPNFGVNGSVNFVSGDSKGPVSSMVVLPNGKILLGGMKDQAFALTRLNKDGSLDTGFGPDGVYRTPFGISVVTTILSIASVPGDGIVAAGSTLSSAGMKVGLAKYIGTAAVRRTPFDFDGDGKADVSVFRSSEGVWYVNGSESGFTGVQWGSATDEVVTGDYDGDGKADPAIFRNGEWWILKSTGGYIGTIWGRVGDTPVPADYDGDGKTDFAIVRDGVWWINKSSGGYEAVQWGASTDTLFPADYDGDGKADPSVVRDGVWWILNSSGGYRAAQWGQATDRLVPADYDGDGKADPAIFRAGDWWILKSTGGHYAVQWGNGSDEPVPADYDGDGKADPSIFRNGDWWILRSAGGHHATQWGLPTDLAVPAYRY